jgi:hypothetical protein
MMPILAAEALFASTVQPSDRLTTAHINRAVEATLLLHGAEGCADTVAQEFGDHPETARRRMRWCLDTVRHAFAMESAR